MGEEGHLRAIGSLRRRQGFRFTTARDAVRRAVSVVRRQVTTGLAGRDAATIDELHFLLDLLDRFGHALEDLLAEGFEARTAEDEGGENDDANCLLNDVVNGHVRDIDVVLFRAHRLACEPSPRALLLSVERSAIDSVAALVPVSAVAHNTAGGRSTHSALVVPTSSIAWASLLAKLEEAASQAGSTLLLIGPSDELSDLYDRYVCARPLLPFLAQLAKSTPVVVDREMALLMTAAALPRDVRAALGRTVLKRPLEHARRSNRILEFVMLFVRHGFSPEAVAAATGVNRKTAYLWRDRATEALGLTLTDPQDQALVSLAQFAVCLADESRAEVG